MARLPDPAVRERWERLIRQHRDSRMTIAEFCEVHDVSTTSFYQWRRKLERSPQPDAFVPIDFVEPQPVDLPCRIRFDAVVVEIPAENTEALIAVIDHLKATQGASQR